MRLCALFQGEVSKQRSEPTPPVCSQRPDQCCRACKRLLPLRLLPHLPHVSSAAAQQEAQALPGAQELQGQLQHSGQHALKSTRGAAAGDQCLHESLLPHSIRVNKYCLHQYYLMHIRLPLHCFIPRCSLCLYPVLLPVQVLYWGRNPTRVDLTKAWTALGAMQTH